MKQAMNFAVAPHDFPSLSAMHRATCERLGPLPALRYRRDGQWRQIAWSGYRREADLAAAGLVALGAQVGDRIGLLSENRIEWLMADHAILSAGAVSVPLYPSSSPAQVEYQLGHCGAAGVIVSSAAQLKKVLAVRDRLPALRFVVVFDPAEAIADAALSSWEVLKQTGRRTPDAAAEAARREAALTPDSNAVIIYTSGTTGRPKGAVLTHGSMIFSTTAVADALRYTSADTHVSWLPYCHVFGRVADHLSTTRMGMTLALAESALTVLRDMAEVRPAYFTTVPRVLEKVWAQLVGLPEEKRAAAARGIFGDRINFLTVGGAPLPAAVGDGLIAAGVPVREGYGMTETASIISLNRRDRWKSGTVGPVIAGIEVRIAEDGEILTRGPHLMRGYWNDAEATARAIQNGWLHTGDLGSLDEAGLLRITGRKKELIITAGGKNITPNFLEDLLLRDEFIEQAVVFGDGRPFVVALLVPRAARLAEAAREAGADNVPEDAEFLSDPRLVAWFQQRVDAAMKEVSTTEAVKKILLRRVPLTAEREELTPTLKLRRSIIFAGHQAELDALYQDT
jgi:long-chain acyl-CoA synthetase